MEGWAHNRFILEQDTRKACSLRSFCFVALLDIHTEEAGRCHVQQLHSLMKDVTHYYSGIL